MLMYEIVSMYDNTTDSLWKIMEISVMSVFEDAWVNYAKPQFLHSLDVLIKMFANSLTILN